MILENVTYETLKRLPRYEPLYPVYGFEGSEVVMPFNISDDKYPGLLLVNTNGDNLYITKWDEISQIKDKPGFEWVEEPFKLFKDEFDNTFSKDGQRNYMMEQFRLANGILGLCENGGAPGAYYSLSGLRANQESVSDTIKNAYNDKNGELLGGSSINSFYKGEEIRIPLVALNAKRYMSKYLSNSTLIHEFTHQVDFTINKLSNSPLFKGILELESLGDSPILNDQMKKMDHLIKVGSYNPANKEEELIARLHEQKLKYPDEFKKQLPLLNDFYEHIFYSYLEYTLTKSPETIMYLDSFTQYPYSVPEYGGFRFDIRPDPDDRRAIKWDNEYYNKAVQTERNAGWKIRPDGSRSRNLSDPEVIQAKEQLKIAEKGKHYRLNALRNNLSRGIKKVSKEAKNIAHAERNGKQIPSYPIPFITRPSPIQKRVMEQIRVTQKSFLAFKFSPESEKDNFEVQYKKDLNNLSKALFEQFVESYPKIPAYAAKDLFEFDSLDKNTTHKSDTPAILKNAKLLSEHMQHPEYYPFDTIIKMIAIAKNTSNVVDAYQKIKDIEKNFQSKMTPSINDIQKSCDKKNKEQIPLTKSDKDISVVSSPIRPNQQYSTELQKDMISSLRPRKAHDSNINRSQDTVSPVVAPLIKFNVQNRESSNPISAPVRPTVLDKKLARMPKPNVISSETPKKITKVR